MSSAIDRATSFLRASGCSPHSRWTRVQRCGLRIASPLVLLHTRRVFVEDSVPLERPTLLFQHPFTSIPSFLSLCPTSFLRFAISCPCSFHKGSAVIMDRSDLFHRPLRPLPFVCHDSHSHTFAHILSMSFVIFHSATISTDLYLKVDNHRRSCYRHLPLDKGDLYYRDSTSCSHKDAQSITIPH